MATLAQGTCLALVGQDTEMPQARQALEHDLQEKAAEARMGCQGQGLHALALASVAGGKVPLAVISGGGTIWMNNLRPM